MMTYGYMFEHMGGSTGLTLRIAGMFPLLSVCF